MRKFILWILLLFAMLIGAQACAETYVFDELYASMEVPDTYVVLTPKNIAGYAEWLKARGTTMEKELEDFERRGVLLQAWSEENDVCFELRATQNEQTLLMFDVNDQTSEVRGQYRGPCRCPQKSRAG